MSKELFNTLHITGHFIPSVKIQKTPSFLCFQRVQKESSSMEWYKRFLLMQMNSELFELRKMGCRDLSG